MESVISSKQGCSSNGHGGQEQTRSPKPQPKHKIFLSHSGAQKDFVRQLCKDLEAETYYPFFDQRSSSLLKGKKFAPEIIAAAQQCYVAVVVLSEEYLTSKWPMLELVEFVKAMKSGDNSELELFPLFYKISVHDLSARSFEQRWKYAWANIAKDDPDRFNLSWCTKALRELRSSNGLKFQDFQYSEVSYREAIVREISLLLPPDLLDDTSDVIGYDRLCKTFARMFVQDLAEDSKSWGTYKLGLYGMGGLGKTTMCRALCTYFHEDFYGRVCHIELGSKPPLALQKMVLTRLLRLSDQVVGCITSTDKGRKCLKDNMKREPVFLVIDNIIDDSGSRMEASAYLEAGFHPHSKIMITSRSEDIVQALFRDSSSTFCKAMPDLTEEEAGFIFLQRAAPRSQLDALTDGEKRVLKLCLCQCCFSSVGGPIRKHQYHPLALRALAVYYHEIDSMNILSWEKHLEDLDKFKHSRESSDIFGILGLQFSTFDVRKKLLFLDLALYYGTSWKGLDRCLSWLADIHEETRRAMECQLQYLKRSGIINFTPSLFRTDHTMITIHDLYKEFAEWYVSEWAGSEDAIWCIYHKLSTNCLPYALQRSCPSQFWPELKRIWLQNLMRDNLPTHKVQEWRNIVVLQLHSCKKLTVLHLHGFTCLRHLELVDLENLVTFYFSDSASSDRDISIWQTKLCLRPAPTATLESLQYVVLERLTSLKRLPDFSLCASLKSFYMTKCERVLEAPPSFKHCSKLENIHMNWHHCQVSLPKLNTLTSLTSLWIGSTYNMDCKGYANLEGLSACIQLQRVHLGYLPIRSLPGLEKLSHIRCLHLRNCRKLKEIPDVSALTELEELDISLTMLQKIPGVDRLLKLVKLFCTMCRMLSTLPDLHHLADLKYLNTQQCPKLQGNPRVPPQCRHDKEQTRLVEMTADGTKSYVSSAQFDVRAGEEHFTFPLI